VNTGGGNIVLRYINPPGAEIHSDTVKYTFIAADCGDQPRTDNGQRERLEGWFLSMVRCEWSVTQSTSIYYNCIAFSAGLTSTWVDKTCFIPGIGYVASYIDGVGVYHVSIDKMYGDGDNNFEMSDLDAFYATEASLTPTATGPNDATVMYYDGYHAAKKKGCSCGAGKWIMYESKCGNAECIEHVYDQLDGSSYGTRTRYYK
jgi:hypothetical protein